MRGSSKSLPKYRKHKVSGQAIVTLSGTDFYLGPHGSKASKLEYDRLIREWLANGRRLLEVSTEHPITIVELCAEYWRFSKSYYIKNGKPTDEQAGVKAAIRALKATYAKSLAKEFGPLALEAVRQQMIASGNSRRYINQNIGRIKRMFKWGVSKELLPVSVYQSLQTVVGLKHGKCKAKETSPILPVDDTVVDATVEFAPRIIADMIRFQQLTGCRPGEVRSLRPIEVDRSKAVWRYTPGTHKMEHKGRHRVILIGPQAQAILLPYLLRQETDPCFLKPNGDPFSRSDFAKLLNSACDKAFPAAKGTRGEALLAWRKQHRWAPNRLRHSRATKIREQYGLEAAQAVLGHSNADVTQIYAERDIVKAAKIMAEVG
jgi:integrase